MLKPTAPSSSALASPANHRQKTTVAMGFVTGMLAGMDRNSADFQQLLLETGIDIADPASRIPVDRYAALYNRVNQSLDDEGFGLFSRPMRPGSFEFLCRGTVSAPNLAVALTRCSRFLRTVLPDITLTVNRDGDSALLCLAENQPLATRAGEQGRIFAFEWLLRLLHGLSCWLVGRGLALDEVRFPYARPEHADDYRLIYTENSQFGGNELHARFRANLLDLPIRRDEAALERFLDGAPGKLTTLYRRDREMVIRVRDLLRAALPASPGQEEIAARLFLSSRTLHRRLEEEGSSFRSIKEALRRDMALARLAKTGDAIARIAADLGYADNSAFYRAFIEWTGMAPAHYRRQWQDKLTE